MQRLLAARIDRLDEATKTFLQTAAVIGDEVAEILLERVTGLDHDLLAFAPSTGLRAGFEGGLGLQDFVGEVFRRIGAGTGGESRVPVLRTLDSQLSTLDFFQGRAALAAELLLWFAGGVALRAAAIK